MIKSDLLLSSVFEVFNLNMMTSSPRTSDNTSCGTTSKGFLNTIATGLFVNWEKRNVLIDGVVKTLRERFHTCVEFGDRQSDGTCQLILYALNPLSPPPPVSLSLSLPKFAGSKALLEKYLRMLKATRPNFHFEKQPETIDLDSSDDETPVTIIRHGFESNSSKPDDGNDEERVKNEKEPVFIEKSSNVNVLFVDLIDENEKDKSLASDVECGEVKSSAKIMKKPDSALLKENDLIHKEDDDSLSSDVECVFVKSPENEEQTQDILDISEDVIIVDACDEEHQNNLSNKGKQNVNNVKITYFRGERMVCFTPESDTTEENYKRSETQFESGNCKSKSKKKRPMSDKVSKISKKRTVEAGPSKEKCTNERTELPKQTSMIGNETHTVEGSANDNTNEVNSKKNDSSVATSSETKNIGTLLSYRRLPHLTKKSANKSPSSSLSNIFNPDGPIESEQDESFASDVVVKSPENEEQTQVVLDISDDVIIVDACDEEHNQNNLSDKVKQNLKNVKITSFRGERMVCFTPESDTTEENYKRYYPWEFESGNCKSKSKKKRPMSDKVSKISKKRTGEAGKEKCTNERMELPKLASMIGNETTHTVEDSANDNTNEVNRKENDSSVATSSETKNIGTLLSYRRLPHLTQKSANKSPSSSLSNIFNPVGPVLKRSGLRPIVIDASNVAISHGKSKFSTKGLQICINYFEKRGHRQIKAFVPQYRKNRETHDALERMEHQGTVVITPSRRVDNKTVASYDDRFIVQYAHEVGGIIISRDNFRDLALENPEWKETIERRTLMFSWVEDMLMFPQDPLGKDGPSLDKYLRFPD